VVAHLKRNHELIAARAGVDLEIRKVAVRDTGKDRGVSAEILTTDWREVVFDPRVDVVVELMGGVDRALEVALATIEAGKPFVTANKAMLAEKGSDLFQRSTEAGVPVFFEASVAGGIPILKALTEGLRANRIEKIHGIVNGTCNYILTRMDREHVDFSTILAEAKELGYAEADEALDVDGIDAAHKAALLAGLAFGFPVPFEEVHVEGIREITPLDMKFAEKLGYTIKLLTAILPEGESLAQVRVHPALVPRAHVLANIDGVFNAVLITGDVVGPTLFYGRGAGADPTASAVLADMIEAAQGNAGLGGVLARQAGAVLPMEKVEIPYYARLTVLNQPGVLAQVAGIFGDYKIGISSVFQPEDHTDPDVPLILLLDRSREADLQAAIREIKALKVVVGPCQVIRVEDFK